MASRLIERNKEISRTLGTVATNGQAIVAAWRAVKHAEAAQADLADYPFDIAAQNAIRSLGDYIRQIARFVAPLEGGDPNVPVSDPTWRPLKNTIGGTYALLFAIEENLSADSRETFATLAGQIFIDAVQAFPKVVEAALEGVGTLAGAVGAGAGKGIGEILKGAWPLLLAAAVIVGAGIYLATSTGAGRAALKARAGA